MGRDSAAVAGDEVPNHQHRIFRSGYAARSQLGGGEDRRGNGYIDDAWGEQVSESEVGHQRL